MNQCPALRERVRLADTVLAEVVVVVVVVVRTGRLYHSACLRTRRA